MISNQVVSVLHPATETKGTYYRLIALWVLCEAMLGGIIHGLKLPVSGLVVGSCAVVCICLIAWYVPAKGAILKATLIVAIFKMMLSPQAPLPAYIAVFFQGLMGELLFWNRRSYAVSCIMLAVLAMLESGLQRILVFTVIYGSNLWTVLNDFMNNLTGQKQPTNYSLIVGTLYVVLHFITGVIVGSWAARLPARITRWRENKQYAIMINDEEDDSQPVISRKKRRLKTGAIIFWVLLMLLYVQSYYHIGRPLLPSHISLQIFLRSLIIVLAWAFVVGPALTRLLHTWLRKKQTNTQQDVEEVLRLLPATRQLATQCWKRTAGKKGWPRVNMFGKMVLVNALTPLSVLWRESRSARPPKAPPADIFILSAPVRTGKTTSLVDWSAGRSDVYGILTPVIKGRRFFMDAQSKEQFNMEASEDDEELLAVGRYIFSKNNFEKAVQIIRDAIHEEGWLVIDEIGPLELRGEGFSEVLREVLSSRQERILLVVRDKDEAVARVKDLIGPKNVVVLNNIERLP